METGVLERRVLAIHLPEFLCELALRFHGFSLEESREPPPPVAVFLAQRADDVCPQQRLAAVCRRAFCAGVRPGQTSAEANAVLAGVRVEVVEYRQVHERLLAIAEAVARYGMTPSWNAWLNVDALWLDISGVGHLHGGERQLCEELAEQVRTLGHRVRLAVAGGPRIAQAVARFGHGPLHLVDSSVEAGAQALSDLPLAALPLDPEHVFWLGRLGIFQVGQLMQLPRPALSARLGRAALEVLQLVQGIDPVPLVAGEFPRSMHEECTWEDPAEGISPLLFALHGITARLCARLEGRGEACARIECEILHDPSLAKHLRVSSTTIFDFDLANPLHHQNDLERVIRTRLQACELLAPSVGLRIHLRQLTHQPRHQLDLGRTTSTSQASGPWAQEFPVLIAELQADIGSERVGTLDVSEGHVPEDCSVFRPLSGAPSVAKASKRRASSNRAPSKLGRRKPVHVDHKLGLRPEGECLTRLLPYPHKINVPLREGETFALGSHLYVIKKLRFVRRVGDVKWWKETSLSRDYHWAWLGSVHGNARGGTEALLFVDKKTGEGFVQAFCD